MMIVSVLSATLLLLSAQPAPVAPVVVAKRGLDQVTLKSRGATISQVMETLKQEAQIESAQIDPKFAGVAIDGEWTAKDWDELLFVALSGVPQIKVLVAGGPDGTDWEIVAGSEAFLTEFQLKPKTLAAEKAPGGSDATTKKPVAKAAASDSAPEVVEPVVEKTEEEVKEEQGEALATFTAIVAPPAGPAIAGQHVVLPFPDENGQMPMATRQAGPPQLPFPGFTESTAAKGPFPPSKDPAMQALIDIVNQKNAAKK